MLSVREAALQIEVAPRTLYRWLVEHRAFLNLGRQGKRLLIHPDSLDILRRISSRYADGETTAQVNENLQKQSLPLILPAESPDIPPSSGVEVLQQVLGELQALHGLRELAEESRAENATLRSILAHQADELTALRHELGELRSLLTPPSPPAEVASPVPPVSPRRRQSFWGWLRGTSAQDGQAETG